jgi:serine/threonine protein phosphatase PrpC
MPWRFGSAVDIGGRNEQQDRVAVLHADDRQRHLIVLADGMGGLRDGALAAQTLVDAASHRFSEPLGDSAFNFLHDICLTAHAALRQLSGDVSPAPGTTMVTLYLDERTASWMHVGDSRLYHFRKGRLLTCTNDHSMLRMMLTEGLIEAGSGEAAAAQNRLYMRLGSEAEPEPDFNSSKLEDGDLFLLCSDGFWQVVEPEEVLKVLAQHPLDQDGSQYLVNLARQRGGQTCDNISLIVAQWHTPSCWQRLSKFRIWRKSA